VSVEFTVIDETEFVDRTDPGNPVERILVTYQTPEGRVGSQSFLKKGYDKNLRNKTIADLLKKSPPRPPEHVKM
jgi:hypothetical protein